MRILYLSRVRLNPYVELLARGVHRADASIHTMLHLTLSWPRILLDPRWRILHLHWIELQYAYENISSNEAARNLKRLLQQLAYVQKRGRSLVYTVHNLNHHEGKYADLNDQANRWIFAHADAIHVHNKFAATQVRQQYGRQQNVFIIPHGNYIGVYPNEIKPEEARARLGIPQDHFVYLCLGQMRPYKGLDALIKAFLQNNAPNTSLLLAGQIKEQDYANYLHRLAGEHPNIHVIPRYIPGKDIQLYCKASNLCVLPYRDATTSGAALLAFSFAKPIIAPAIGPFPELVGNNERGILFHPQEADLANALAAARSADITTMANAARAFAEARDWKTIGSRHAQVYHQLQTR